MSVLKKSLDVAQWKEEVRMLTEKAAPFVQKLNEAANIGTMEALAFAARDLAIAKCHFGDFGKQIRNLPKCSDNVAQKARTALLEAFKIYHIAVFFGTNLMQTITRVAAAHQDGEKITTKEEKDLIILRSTMAKNIAEAQNKWQIFISWYYA